MRTPWSRRGSHSGRAGPEGDSDDAPPITLTSYFGVRVTTDFSMQKSLDRVGKTVRLAININERKKIVVAFEGNSGISSSTLRDELTLLSRGAYDDFDV